MHFLHNNWMTYFCAFIFWVNMIIEMNWIYDIYMLPAIAFMALTQMVLMSINVYMMSPFMQKIPHLLVTPLYCSHVCITWDQVPFVEMNWTRVFMCIVPISVSLGDWLVTNYPQYCWTLWKIKRGWMARRNPLSKV